MNKLDLPHLLIDSNKVRLNLEKMVMKAKNSGVEFRPHFKTHQSRIIGKWFKEAGVNSITVSSLKMAEYFAEDGWMDITVAFPVNILEFDRLSSLAEKIKLHVLAVDSETLRDLDSKLTSKIGIYIELDPGYGRSGISFLDTTKIQTLLETINKSRFLSTSGFYTHTGHTYKCRSKNEINDLSSVVLSELKVLKEKFNLPICFGDTPSCSILNDFGIVNQVSPGNFIFYDWMQTQIGSCSDEQIAVTVKCPVVAKFPERNELLIHGGAIHFSKETLEKPDGTSYFGIVQTNENDWTKRPFLKSISQEHGIISADKDYINKVAVGDEINIYPIHSCLTANLMRQYFDEHGNRYDHMSGISI